MNRVRSLVIVIIAAISVGTIVAVLLVARKYAYASADKGILWSSAWAAVGSIAAAGTALCIAIWSASRDEVVRHDAVRPLLTAKVQWLQAITEEQLDDFRRTDGPVPGSLSIRPASFSVNLHNDGLQVAVAVQVGFERVREGGFPLAFIPLTTPTEARFRYNLAVGATTEVQYADEYTDNPVVAATNEWYLTVYFDDVLGWHWRARRHIRLTPMNQLTLTKAGITRVMPSPDWQDLIFDAPTPISALPHYLPPT